MFHPDGPTFFELARQALSSVERGYDLLAPKFDHTPFRTPDALIEAALARIGGPASLEAAIDLGCGTGAVMRHLRPMCRERVVGVDLSQGMLARAELALKQAPGSAHVELLRGDLLSLPPDSAFDLATCFGVLGHIPEAESGRLFRSVRGALRVGGRFVFPSGEVPPLLSTGHLLSRGFNAAMHVRNALWRPPFVMLYLRFLLPDVRTALERAGFAVRIERDVFPPPFGGGALVVATRTR